MARASELIARELRCAACEGQVERPVVLECGHKICARHAKQSAAQSPDRVTTPPDRAATQSTETDVASEAGSSSTRLPDEEVEILGPVECPTCFCVSVPFRSAALETAIRYCESKKS